MDQEFSRRASSGETLVVTKREIDDMYNVSLSLQKLNPGFELPSIEGLLIGDTDSICEGDLVEFLKSVNLLHLFRDIFHDTSSTVIGEQGSPEATQLAMQYATSSESVSYTAQEKQALEFFLEKIFVSETNQTKDEEIFKLNQILQEFQQLYPNETLNLKISIDERGSTPLHWLCSLANSYLIKEIVEIQKNGSMRIEMDITLGDCLGESALVKAVKSVNNYENGSFESILEVLYPTLNLIDNEKRTILHHIILQTGKNGYHVAAKYYLDIFMGWIVKPDGTEINGELITLKWFITNILNAQDIEGDTCLNIASRLGNVAIVNLLMDYGADPSIANNSGLKPLDFGAGIIQFESNDAMGRSDILKGNRDVSQWSNNRSNSLDSFSNSMTHKKLTYELPDNAPMMEMMQSLIGSINTTYKEELITFNEQMGDLQKNIYDKKYELQDLRTKISNYKDLKDKYYKIEEQINSLNNGIADLRNLFEILSKDFPELLNTRKEVEDDEIYDADEFLKIEPVFQYMNDKLASEYNGDFEKFEQDINIDNLVVTLTGLLDAETLDNLPSLEELNFRLKIYKDNEECLDQFYTVLQHDLDVLEKKFRKVLSTCLKVDESEVDGMLDGLLEAITNEDLDDLSIDEVQVFLRKNGTLA